MNLINLLENEGGGNSVAKLAGKLGIDPDQARKLIDSLSPEVTNGMQQQAQSPEGRAELERDLQSDKYQRYLDEPEQLDDETARAEGDSVLSHLLGSKDKGDVAARASQDTGLDQSLIERALPMVAGMVMGAFGRKANQEGGGLSSLTGLLGSDGKPGMDDLRNLGGKLF